MSIQVEFIHNRVIKKGASNGMVSWVATVIINTLANLTLIYIIFRNVEIFKNYYFSKSKKNLKDYSEYLRIFHLLKWAKVLTVLAQFVGPHNFALLIRRGLLMMMGFCLCYLGFWVCYQ